MWLRRIDHVAKWSLIKQLTGTDEAAGRRCLTGLQVLIKQLTGADQLAEIGRASCRERVLTHV